MSTASSSSSKPLALRRHDEILKRIAAAGSVSVSELADHFDVARETIRRDLKLLADRGRLDIVHGGAARRESLEPALDLRASENAVGKAAMARVAAEMVEDGMVLVVDSGTSTLALVESLAGKRGLTICTSGLTHAMRFAHMPDMRVHMLGGEIDVREEATSGVDAIEAIRRFRVDLAFVGCGGLSPDGEVTDYLRSGAELRAAMIAAAPRAYFLLDQTKFGRLTPIRIPRSQDAGLITDAAPPAPLAANLAKRGVEVIVAG